MTQNKHSMNEFLASLAGQRMPGGCEYCNAEQEFVQNPNRHGPNHLNIHHDDWCPDLAAMEQANNATSATVSSLTAQINVIQVGGHEISADIVRQLDIHAISEIEVFGRVRLIGDMRDFPHCRFENHEMVIGRDFDSGDMVLAIYDHLLDDPATHAQYQDIDSSPLITLDEIWPEG